MTTEAKQAVAQIIDALGISELQKTVLYNAIDMIVTEEIRKATS